LNVALVPVKRLGEGKSRLLGALDRAALDALTLAMLGDVVSALQASGRIDRVAVVTPDEHVAAAARALGAEALVRLEPGLNPSLDAASGEICGSDDTLLVVLGDVAGAAPDEIAELYDALEARPAPNAAMAAARDGGTAALLRSPADAFTGCFGPKSAEAHRAAAKAANVPIEERALESLAIDLDHRDDLDALLAGDGPAPRTRELLHQLGIGASS
jgi:2-phospho-L-lactate guanylyltransferase